MVVKNLRLKGVKPLNEFSMQAKNLLNRVNAIIHLHFLMYA
jgi:hypothetical protein